MYEVLKLFHVLGWSGWFGLAIAEAIVGAQTRRADANNKAALASTWSRVGRLQLILMVVAVLFGLVSFFYLGSSTKDGMSGFMRDKANVYLHVMLGLGLLAGIFALLAGQARGTAIAAAKTVNEAGFTSAYKRASAFSGIATLLILITMAVVILHTAF
jgi:hypothetical protein